MRTHKRVHIFSRRALRARGRVSGWLTLALMLALSLTAAPGRAEAPAGAFSLFSAPEATASPPPAAPQAPQAQTGFTLTVLDGANTRVAARTYRVLIYHSHTYEAYTATEAHAYVATERWRTADNTRNVAAVGAYLAELLRGAGLEVTHDSTAFEPPALSSAYERSLAMLERRHADGERYDLYIDLHRDAYSEGNGANVTQVAGESAARLMLLVGKGTGQTNAGYALRPDWEANLALAQSLTDALNGQAPGLCRSVALKSGRYNQHIAPRCVLIEVGNNRNTLAEALSAMPCLANAICAVLDN